MHFSFDSCCPKVRAKALGSDIHVLTACTGQLGLSAWNASMSKNRPQGESEQQYFYRNVRFLCDLEHVRLDIRQRFVKHRFAKGLFLQISGLQPLQLGVTYSRRYRPPIWSFLCILHFQVGKSSHIAAKSVKDVLLDGGIYDWIVKGARSSSYARSNFGPIEGSAEEIRDGLDCCWLTAEQC